MSMAPVPGMILDFFAVLNQGLTARSSVDSTIAQALTGLVSQWPEVQSLRVYRADGAVLAATPAVLPPLPSAQIKHSSAAVQVDGRWLVTTHEDQGKSVVLEATGTLENPSWLQLIVRQIQQLVSAGSTIDAYQYHQYRLADLNRALLTLAEHPDVPGLLRALRRFATNALTITHESMVYDQQRMTDIVTRHILTLGQIQHVEISLRATGDAAQVAAMLDYWQEYPASRLIFVEDVATVAPEMQVIIEPVARQGVSSTIFLPIFRSQVLRDIIRIDFPSAQVFTAPLRETFNAVHSQITLLLQLLYTVESAQQHAAGLEQQVPVLRLISDLSTVISITRDERQLLTQSAQAFVEVLQADYCRVYMVDQSGVGAVFCEYPNRGAVGQRFTLSELPVNIVPDAASPKPVVVNNLWSDGRLDASTREILYSDGVRALALLPVFTDNQLRAIFRLDITDETRTFSPDMQDLMQTVQAQVVVGLENIRLLRDTGRNYDQLRQVNQFGQALQATLERDVILQTVLHESQRVISVTQQYIAMLVSPQETVEIVGQWLDGQAQVFPEGQPGGPLDNIVWHEAWQTQQPYYVPDTAAEPDQQWADVLPGLRSVLVLPLVVRSNVIGVVVVGHAQPYSYTETDVIVFYQMMSQLAAALENARLLAQSRYFAQRAALLNDIGTRLQTTISVEHTLNEAARGLQEALNAGRVAIRLGQPPANSQKDS